MKPTPNQIKTSVSQCTDLAFLAELEKHIRERKRQIADDAFVAKKEKFWNDLKFRARRATRGHVAKEMITQYPLT